MSKTNKAITEAQLRATAARVANEVSSAAAQDIEALKPRAVNFTIPVNGWAEDAEAADFSLYYDLTVQGVTAYDRATVVIAPSSIAEANACGLCPTNETLTNKIRLRARTAPADPIQAVYWLEEGRNN